MLLLPSQSFASVTAKAMPLYYCGFSNNADRCHATLSWIGGVDGSETHIFTNQIYGGNCFIQNTMWLAQETSGGDYWIEAGIRAINTISNGADSTFWADFRPNGLGFSPHYGAPLSAADHGKYAQVVIVHPVGTAYGVWSVGVTGLPNSQITGPSTQNFISPNDIDIGMEICGTGGANAPRNGFTGNRYHGLNGNWAYQGKSDGLQNPQQSPAYGNWTTLPSRSSTGGQWTTCVISSGC